MPTDPETSSWIPMLVGAMLGIFLRAPETRKSIVYMSLLLGLVWLIGGALFGFDATEFVISEVVKFLFCAFLIVFVIFTGIALWMSLTESPGAAIAVLLLWFGLSGKDKDE